MLDTDYKRAFDQVVPSPQLVRRTERSIEDMINGKKVRRMTARAALVAAVLIVVLAAAAFAAGGALLAWLVQDGQMASQIEKLIQPVGATYQGDAVTIHVEEALLTGDNMALSWTVTNNTDGRLYVGAPTRFRVNGGYLTGGGSAQDDFDYYLEPGATVAAKLNDRVLPGDPVELEDSGPCTPLTDAGNQVEIGLSIYQVPDAWGDSTASPEDAGHIPWDTDFGQTFPAQGDTWALVEAAHLTVTLDRTLIQAHQAAPRSFEFEGYTLQIDRAEITPTGASFAWKVIHPTRAAALARPVGGTDGYWSYEIDAADGEDWHRGGSGHTSDQPVELPDGRWAWEESMQYSTILRIPDAFTFTPCHYGNGQLTRFPDQAVTITLD